MLHFFGLQDFEMAANDTANAAASATDVDKLCLCLEGDEDLTAPVSLDAVCQHAIPSQDCHPELAPFPSMPNDEWCQRFRGHIKIDPALIKFSHEEQHMDFSWNTAFVTLGASEATAMEELWTFLTGVHDIHQEAIAHAGTDLASQLLVMLFVQNWWSALADKVLLWCPLPGPNSATWCHCTKLQRALRLLLVLLRMALLLLQELLSNLCSSLLLLAEMQGTCVWCWRSVPAKCGKHTLPKHRIGQME